MSVCVAHAIQARMSETTSRRACALMTSLLSTLPIPISGPVCLIYNIAMIISAKKVAGWFASRHLPLALLVRSGQESKTCIV
jgi:hypothetical protein